MKVDHLAITQTDDLFQGRVNDDLVAISMRGALQPTVAIHVGICMAQDYSI